VGGRIGVAAQVGDQNGRIGQVRLVAAIDRGGFLLALCLEFLRLGEQGPGDRALQQLQTDCRTRMASVAGTATICIALQDTEGVGASSLRGIEQSIFNHCIA
jgi:hypothetical protein